MKQPVPFIRQMIFFLIREVIGHSVGWIKSKDEDRIKQTEKVLGVTFPESYKWFLRKYGTSASIYGIGLSETPVVVKHTLNYREFGLPKSFVVIKDVGEWVYCLDTGRMKNNECAVIDWDIRGESHRLFENFFIYLLKMNLKVRSKTFRYFLEGYWRPLFLFNYSKI